jgi:hypothetical protein
LRAKATGQPAAFALLFYHHLLGAAPDFLDHFNFPILPSAMQFGADGGACSGLDAGKCRQFVSDGGMSV